MKEALELNREVLNGISVERLIELDKMRLTDAEYENRAADAEVFYRNHFKDLFILEELKYLGETAENDQMLLFARGHINAYKKIKQWFEQQTGVINLTREREKEEKEE